MEPDSTHEDNLKDLTAFKKVRHDLLESVSLDKHLEAASEPHQIDATFRGGQLCKASSRRCGLYRKI